MARQMPVKDGVKIKRADDAPVMFENVAVGPNTGNGYYAAPGDVIEVERRDYDAMVALPQWEAPKRKPRAVKPSNLEGRPMDE
jgi:hypothetical protein